MNDNIITAIIASATTIVVTWITVLYTTIYPKKKELELLSKQVKEKDEELQKNLKVIETLKSNNEIVSTGVALGYFNNFIKRIFNKVNEGNSIEVQLFKKGENLEDVQNDEERKTYHFEEDNIRFVIILPKDLNAARLKDADNLEKSKTKALLVSKGRKRDFSFFCEIINDKDITIYDYPNPFDAVRKFIAADDRYGYKRDGNIILDLEANSDIAKRYAVEIQNFKDTITIMSEKDDNKSIVNKIDFKQLS